MDNPTTPKALFVPAERMDTSPFFPDSRLRKNDGKIMAQYDNFKILFLLRLDYDIVVDIVADV